MNADKLWKQYDTFRKRYAAKYAPAIYKALQGQIKYYTETRDLVNLPTQPMTDTLRSLYKEVGRIWAANTYYNILKDAGIRKPLNSGITLKRRGAIGLNEE